MKDKIGFSKKLKVLFSSIFVVILSLSTLVGCEGLPGGGGNSDGMEGRYRFVSRTEYEISHKLGANNEILYEKEFKEKYEIGDTFEKYGDTHTFSKDSYILDVYEDNTFFLTSHFNVSDSTTSGYNPYAGLIAFKYTWYKETQDYSWSDVSEWYYFVRKNLDEPQTEEFMLYQAYREDDAIILTIFDIHLMTEIRLEKVEMNEEEKAQNKVVGRYHLSTIQAVEEGEEVNVTAGVPDNNGYATPYNQFVFILNADGSVSLSDDGQIFGSLLENIQTGTWRIENGNVIMACEIFEKAFAKSEITLKVEKNKLILDEVLISPDSENIPLVLTLEK